YAKPNVSGAGDHNTPGTVLYIELVNMLTEDATGNASDLDLRYWDFILAKEGDTRTGGSDAYGDGNTPYFAPVYVRPDPVTGQVPAVDPADVTPRILPDVATTAATGQVRPVVVVSGQPIDPANRQAGYTAANAALDPKVRALSADGGNREY